MKIFLLLLLSGFSFAENPNQIQSDTPALKGVEQFEFEGQILSELWALLHTMQIDSTFKGNREVSERVATLSRLFHDVRERKGYDILECRLVVQEMVHLSDSLSTGSAETERSSPRKILSRLIMHFNHLVDIMKFQLPSRIGTGRMKLF